MLKQGLAESEAHLRWRQGAAYNIYYTYTYTYTYIADSKGHFRWKNRTRLVVGCADPGTQFTCFTSSKVQILTPGGNGRALLLSVLVP